MELGATLRSRAAHARGRALRTSVAILAGALLLLVFLRLLDVGAAFRRLAHLSVGLALLSGAVFLAAYVVRALRWRVLLRPYRVRIRTVAAIYQVATFLNWLLPVRGGEVAMSLLLRHTDGIPIGRSFATVSMDKAMDLLPAIGLLALTPLVGIHLGHGLLWLLVPATAMAGLGVLTLIVLAWRPERAVALVGSLLGALLPGRAWQRIEPAIVQFLDTLAALLRRPRTLLAAGAFTLVAIGLDAMFCLLAFRAVGVALSARVALYGYTVYNLSFILPSLPGQVGSNELVGLAVFSGLFGVPRSGVGAMFLFSHPLTGILMTCSGLCCLRALGLSLRGAVGLLRPKEAASR